MNTTVISGYLISTIIIKEIRDDTFSLKEFYFRRAIRLLPGLFSVLFFTSLFAFYNFYPIELLGYLKSLMVSLLFSANFYFYTTLNYFSLAADTIPLLHLWSLGIEEQFYLFFPILILILHRCFITSYKIAITLIILILFSLFSQVLFLKSFPMAAFYLPQLRAFELLIGAVIAFLNISGIKNTLWASLIGLMGCSCILIAVLGFSVATRFPGYAVLLPCIGAACIIVAGEKSHINRVLMLKPLTYMGKLSYSLYLVHWPIVVFLKRLYPLLPPSG